MPADFTPFDRSAMARALELAARGLETTHPNPRVGCVIAQGDRIVGEGWHEWAGEPHAEVMALRAAGERAAGGTAYVTLEPCSHFGRTPPCVDALIEARIGRVVFAVGDPNSRVDGRGAESLRRAGIRVESGLMSDEAAELNAGFIQRMRCGRPWVRLKLAMSLDGRTALSNGASRWITGEAAREDVQRWRARSSAVLTGSGTVLADDPRLDVRLPAQRRRQPMRVVLDSELRTPPDARLFSSEGKVLIFAGAENAARRQALEARGARVELVEHRAQDASAQASRHVGERSAGEVRPATRAGVASSGPGVLTAGGLDLHQVLGRLGALEVNELLIEAGATLSGAFIREGLVDELLIYMAPMLLGPQARPLLELPELTSLNAGPRFSIIDTCRIGADARLRLRPA